MLDVHPPEHTPHTWKDFLIHMAAICLGLLLAIGLEQSVEWVHHRREINELHEALRRDTEKQIEDTQRMEARTTWYIQYETARMQQVGEALRTHQPLAKPLPVGNGPGHADIPQEPAWGAAKTSGLLAFAPQQDIVAYSEVDLVIDLVHTAYLMSTAATERLTTFHSEIEAIEGPGVPAFSTATPAQLQTYLEDLSETRNAMALTRSTCRQLRGADTAILSGERDLAKIEVAERQFDKLP